MRTPVPTGNDSNATEADGAAVGLIEILGTQPRLDDHAVAGRFGGWQRLAPVDS